MTQPPNVSGLTQVAISVTGLDRAVAFYRDVLGLPFLFSAPPGLAFFQAGATRLMLTSQDGGATGSHPILYYGVPDIRAAVDAVRAAGAVIKQDAVKIATVGGKDVWLAATEDPDGHVVGLMSEVPAAA